MNKRLATTGAALIAAFGLTTGVNAQGAEGRVKIGDAEGKAKIQADVDRDSLNRDHLKSDSLGDKEHQKGVTKFHKASGLIGMNVVNSQNENLGEIKDIVLDMETGRISYAVLSVGGFLGIGDKYIAVPPSAFMKHDVDEKLVLNADKAKIQQAPGFVKTDWPSFDNPSWGAYWDDIKDSDVDATGKSGARIESDVDVDLKKDRSADRDLNRDRDTLDRSDRTTGGTRSDDLRK